MPFDCHVRDGDLLVIAVSGVIRAADIPVLKKAEAEFFQSRPGASARFLCDCTQMKVVAPEAMDALLRLMKEDTPHLAKAAFVVAEGVNALQIGRMLRETSSPKRQMFATVDQAETWLAEP